MKRNCPDHETTEEREERKAMYMGTVARASKGMITKEIWEEASKKFEEANKQPIYK